MVPSFWRHIDQDFHGSPDAASTAFATFFKVAIVFFVVVFWLLSAVSLANGILILKRKRHRLCMWLSGISLLGTPLNLVVGILSLVTLNNAWARNLFAHGRQT